MLLCAVVLLRAVYRYDLYDREPWWAVLLAVALGAGAMWLCGVVQTALIHRFPVFVTHQGLSIPALAAVTEEAAKAAVVVAMALLAPRRFNDPLDGLVYGSLAGLGCAIEESLAWTLGRTVPAELGPEVVRLAGHLVMGGVAGFGLGFAMARPARRVVLVTASLGAAMTLHFVWDVIAWSAANRPGAINGPRAVAVIVMLAGMLLYRWLVAVGARASRAFFAPGVTAGSAGPRSSTSR